jgi:hypothetical protein
VRHSYATLCAIPAIPAEILVEKVEKFEKVGFFSVEQRLKAVAAAD